MGTAPVPLAGTCIRWKLGPIRAGALELGCEISFQGVGEAPAFMIYLLLFVALKNYILYVVEGQSKRVLEVQGQNGWGLLDWIISRQYFNNDQLHAPLQEKVVHIANIH